jgi:disulfide bond formation protein DsbB
MQGDAAAGKTKFGSTCVSCHGADAKGIPGLGKDMTTSTFIKSQSDDQLVTFVTKGRPSSDAANTTKVDMPPKGGNPAFTEKDLYDIVAFIRAVSK